MQLASSGTSTPVVAGDVIYVNAFAASTDTLEPVPLPPLGRLYTIVNGGILSCLDASAGKLLYRERINAPGPYFSAPVAAAGRVYTASSEGIVTVFKSGDTLDILAKNDLGEPIFATPAPVGNTLYMRTSRHLWAFRGK